LLRVRRLLVVGPPVADGPAHTAACLLADRLRRRSGCAVDLRTGRPAPANLPLSAGGEWDAVFLVAAEVPTAANDETTSQAPAIAALRQRFGRLFPAPGTLQPEGFSLRTLRAPGCVPLVVVLGADSSGAIYGVGHLLREIVPGDGWCDLPTLHREDAPAFAVRGTGLAATSGAVASALRLPRWTLAQWEEQVADLALWGYNLLRCGGNPAQVAVARRYGLRIGVSVPPNRIAEEAVTEEMLGTHFQRALVCPSNAAARGRIMSEREALFRECPHLDVLYLPSGDHAGCHCPRCRPWVRTYLTLAEEIADVLRRYHPGADVWLSNQQLSIAENRLLLDYLRDVQPAWLQALHYGPSGDEASPYLRPGEVNWEWQTYRGFGTVNRFLAHLRAALPAQYALVLYPDLTHYLQSQYGVETVDPAVVRLHGRDAYFVRAEGYRRVFERVGPLIAGSSAYTEGIYDDVQKALWAQWLWNPDLSTADAVDTYCRWSFGPGAAPALSQVLLALEQHWEGPLPPPPAIDATADLAATAAVDVPVRLRTGNWRLTYLQWRTQADQLVRRKLSAAHALERQLETLLAPAVAPARAAEQTGASSPDMEALIREALRLIAADRETVEASLAPLKASLRTLDDRLCDESGVRAPGTRHLELDLGHACWDLEQLTAALDAARADATARAQQLIRAVIGYEDAGPRGWYDDLGHAGKQAHLRFGHSVPRYCNVAVPPDLAAQRPLPWDVPIYDPANRPSQNTFAFTYRDEPGVRLAYLGLDPEAPYRLRLTYCVPRTWPRRFAMQQRLEANGLLVHDTREVPEYTAEQVEFALPRETITSGAVELQFHAAPGSMGTAVSEVWLLRED
jgi:hypothetical protein